MNIVCRCRDDGSSDRWPCRRCSMKNQLNVFIGQGSGAEIIKQNPDRYRCKRHEKVGDQFVKVIPKSVGYDWTHFIGKI